MFSEETRPCEAKRKEGTEEKKEKTKCGIIVEKTMQREEESLELRADRTEEEKKIFGFFGFINTIKRTNGKSVR